MIPITVPLAEDEMLYSYLMRLADANGLSPDHFASMIGADSFSYRSYGYLGALPVSIFRRSSMYMLLAPLYSRWKQLNIVLGSFRSLVAYPHLFSRKPTDIHSLRVCPLCAAEEIQSYGFFTIKRSHNIPGVTTCYRHHVKLVSYHGKPGDELNLESYGPTDDPLDTEYADFTRRFALGHLECHSEDIVDYLRLQCHVPKTELRRLPDYDPERLLRLMMHYDPGLELSYNHGNEINAFFDSADGYDLYSYSYHLVEMGHHDETFVTTPYGFTLGFGEESFDVISEPKRFELIFQCLISNGEYELVKNIASGKDTITIRHNECGHLTSMTPVAFIMGQRCQCISRYSSQQISSFASSHGIKLISFTNVRSQSTFRCNKGHVFHETFAAFWENPTCPVCENRRGRQVQRLKKYQVALKKQSVFENDVRAVAGNEYTVIGTYTGSRNRITIRHNLCGRTHDFRPVDFLRGQRCPFCGPSIDKRQFSSFVSSVSKGRYEASHIPGTSMYEITDNRTHKCMKYRRELIIQELIRPTPSKILPLEERGIFIPDDLPDEPSNITVVANYLNDHYQPGDTFLYDQLNTGLDKSQNRSAVRGLEIRGIVSKTGIRKYIYKGGSHAENH